MDTVLYVDCEAGSRVVAMKLAGVRRYAEAQGWKVVVLMESQSRPARLRRALLRERPIGCIVECSAGHVDLPPRVFGRTPVVYLDGRRTLYGGRVNAVAHDGASTAKAAFRELLSSRPDAFALVGWNKRVFWSDIRDAAFERLVSATGRPFYRFRPRNETRTERLERLTAWMIRLPRKCAIFAVNDLTAREVVEAASRVRLGPPSDFTLLGVDNDERLCEEGRTTISSVQVDFEQAGYRAAEVLNRVISGSPGEPVTETFGPLLAVRRESTRGFGRREPRITSAMELIRAHACDGLRAKDVVDALGGSRRLSELRFRETVGHSILEEIISVRLERVFQMLRDPSVPISLIVDRSGFPSGRALRKIFLLRVGLSLSEWRERNRR